MVEEAKALARAMGISVITSVEEAEAQCALLNSAGICVWPPYRTSLSFLSPVPSCSHAFMPFFYLQDVCCTGDSDAFLFGAQVVMRRIDLHPAHTTATLYRAAHIRDGLGFGRASLVRL